MLDRVHTVAWYVTGFS